MNDIRQQLYSEEEIEHQNKVNNLKEAIGLFMRLDAEFLKQDGQNESNVKTLFEIQCNKTRETDPTFDKEIFAETLKGQIEGTLERIEKLSEKSFYIDHPTCIQARKYIKYLSKVIGGQISETEEAGNDNTFLTKFSHEQLKKIRGALIDQGFIFNSVNEIEFEYIFTGKPVLKEMKKIKWKIHRGGTALRDFLSLLMPGDTIHKSQVMNCFIDEKGGPFKIGKPKIDQYSKHRLAFENILKSIK